MRHGAQDYNNLDYSKTMYVAVAGDTMYDVNTVSRQTHYKPGLDYDTAGMYSSIQVEKDYARSDQRKKKPLASLQTHHRRA